MHLPRSSEFCSETPMFGFHEHHGRQRSDCLPSWAQHILQRWGLCLETSKCACAKPRLQMHLSREFIMGGLTLDCLSRLLSHSMSRRHLLNLVNLSTWLEIALISTAHLWFAFSPGLEIYLMIQNLSRPNFSFYNLVTVLTHDCFENMCMP